MQTGMGEREEGERKGKGGKGKGAGEREERKGSRGKEGGEEESKYDVSGEELVVVCGVERLSASCGGRLNHLWLTYFLAEIIPLLPSFCSTSFFLPSLDGIY